MPIIADLIPGSGPTLDDLVTEVVATVQGFAVAPDQLATLKTGITAGALTLVVEGDASPGVFEVENELVYVTAVDPNTGTCTVHPRGRGWQGTTASAHAAGSVVSVGPALSRGRCTGLINDTLASLYPAVFGVGSGSGTVDGPMLEIPSEAEAVLDVRVLDNDGDWQRVRHWEAEHYSLAGASGRVVRLPRSCDGDSVQVVYALRPATFTSPDQQWSDTGLSLGLKDVVVLGVLARFAKVLDLGRLTDRFSSPKGDAQQPQLGAGFAMARQLQADFQAALDRETKALRDLYPARSHFVR